MARLGSLRLPRLLQRSLRLAPPARAKSTQVFVPHGIGSPSPWASDPWEQVISPWDEIVERADPTPLLMDTPEALAIPMTEAERATLPSERDILDEYERRLQRRSSRHLGYPYNLVYDHEDLHRFLRYSINNLGDPFVSSNYGVHSREFERAVIDFFAGLWKIEKCQYWGYVTTCGTEGNLHAMLLARECQPNGVLYTSAETHYSIFKAARYYKMDCEAVPTLPMGEIDYDELGRRLAANRGRPAIINVNIGTTVKGAVDNLDRVLRVLRCKGYEREDFHIHCDGALFAMMLPFVDFAPEVRRHRERIEHRQGATRTHTHAPPPTSSSIASGLVRAADRLDRRVGPQDARVADAVRRDDLAEGARQEGRAADRLFELRRHDDHGQPEWAGRALHVARAPPQGS